MWTRYQSGYRPLVTPPTSSRCGEGTGLQAQWDNATGFQGILNINVHLNMISRPEIGMPRSKDLQIKDGQISGSLLTKLPICLRFCMQVSQFQCLNTYSQEYLNVRLCDHGAVVAFPTFPDCPAIPHTPAHMDTRQLMRVSANIAGSSLWS